MRLARDLYDKKLTSSPSSAAAAHLQISVNNLDSSKRLPIDRYLENRPSAFEGALPQVFVANPEINNAAIAPHDVEIVVGVEL